MKIISYDIDLTFKLLDLTYKGREIIRINAQDEPLFLNAADLEIDSISVDGSDLKFDVVPQEEGVRTHQRIRGEKTVEVKFSGKVSEALQGIYAARYKGGLMISTQFESTGARHAFPCLDNPSYKSKFSISITVENGWEVISNTPVKSRTPVSGGVKFSFEETPPMSTYLVYIGIGKFHTIGEPYGGKEIILAAPEGTFKTSNYPVKEAALFLSHYEDYYDFPYVLPKLHLISVPEFAAGAMENWGAITFREILLQVSDSTSDITKQTISEVIAHEIAHQWFGDLVTLEWWNDLWLNESFATFMAFKAVDHVHKSWKFMGR
ncbi:MAG: M1 family metallopeptidase, partial [Thermoplasmataceae archaeon]